MPAHDEQDHLDRCLRALGRCIERTPVPVSVTVVLDACTDRTADRIAGRADVVVVSARNVGAARAAGFAPVVGAPAPPDGLWLATTDADSEVPPEWLTAQLAQAAAGADVVAGTVAVLDWTGWDPAVRLAYEAGYHPGSGHVHGANLGLSARAYRALGGFAPLACHEDVDLVTRARARGLRVVHTATHPVTTSARATARTSDGFAVHLSRLAGS